MSDGTRIGRALSAVERFFTGHGFPAVVIGVVAVFAAGTGALLVIPPAPDGAGAFAEQFRYWCFGADAASGSSNGLMVGITYLEFLALSALVAAVWKAPLRAAARVGVRAFAGPAVGVVVVGGLAAALMVSLALDAPRPVDPTVFQAQALRVAVPAPEIALIDQAGEPVRLSEQKGKVVLLTAVYASCGLACPRIMGQAKRAVATLSPGEQEDLVVLGITLDAAKDTPEVLAKMAAAQKVDRPLYRLLTGEVAEVEAVLDRLDVSRKLNPETGLIDHANIFLLVDKQGKVAYRFTLDPLQEKWLGEAMKLLLAEPTLPTARRG